MNEILLQTIDLCLKIIEQQRKEIDFLQRQLKINDMIEDDREQ